MKLNFLTLTPKATVIGLIMGLLIVFLGRGLGLFFFFMMLWFLVLSAIVSFIGKRYKLKRKLFEDTRGIKNVIANGLWPFLLVLAYYFLSSNQFLKYALIFAFIGSVAAITADKFGSEIGVLDGEPIMLLTLKRVKKGTSGAVTWLGISAGILAAFLQSLVMLPWIGYFGSAGISMLWLFVAAILGGLAGTLFDSILGYFEENGKGNKYTSNFFASVFGSIIALTIFLLLF